MKYRSKIPLLGLCALLQVACTNNTVYPDQSFAYDSLFKLRTDGEVAMACESARRSLLGEGYLIVSANSEGVIGRKAYKSEGKENTFIEMNVVCLPEATGSTVFATGVLSTYELKMSSSAASVGLSALGSISLPIGQSADSLVKVSEETIDDKDFYRRFFAAVDTILGDLMAGKTPEPVAEPAAPVVAPVESTTVSEPVQAPTVSESNPAVAAPMAVPESIPAQVAPAITPVPIPAQEVPVVVPKPDPEPIPLQQAPTIAPEPSPAPLSESSNVITTVT